MDFTREPIVESVVTPKEGCKLVVRSSKGAGQEEYFVDAIEIVSFGHTFFLRSTERPKSFLVPATDYEVIEVRETRMMLKSVGLDRSSKSSPPKEALKKKEPAKAESSQVKSAASDEAKPEPKRRERKRHSRRRRYKDEGAKDEEVKATEETGENVKVAEPTPSVARAILPPPPTLISHGLNAQKKAPMTLDDEPKQVVVEEKKESTPKKKRKVSVDNDEKGDKKTENKTDDKVEAPSSKEGAPKEAESNSG